MQGAKANIYLEYDGNLEDLANKISNDLNIPAFRFDSDQDYPHEIYAMSECLGFEMWLCHSNKKTGCNYEFTIETMHSLNEAVNDKMANLSPWLARYFTEIFKIQANPNIGNE